MTAREDKQTEDQQQAADEQVAESSAPADGSPPDEMDELTALQQERDELFSRLQRVSADYSNYMKRAQNNLSETIELARGDLIKQLLPVLDNFDTALAQEQNGDEARSLREGMRIVRDEFLKALTANGVERIDPSVGEPFDPNVHEAMMRQPAEGVDPNCISMVMQPGYALRGRTLRAAKVAVAPE
jgi:molecular chaperone GrpE